MGDALVAGAITAQTTAFSALMTTANVQDLAYHTYFTAADATATAVAAAELLTSATLLTAYWNDADDAMDKRDLLIQDQIDFMEELEVLKETVDLPMVVCKRDVLTDLGLPTIDRCSSVIDISGFSVDDGDAVELKAEQLSKETSSVVPYNWGMYDGRLMGAKVGSYIGGIASNAEKRRVEAFESSRLSLITNAHQGLKSIYNASDTLAQYNQATAIQSGLADLFVQGFNSAGAGLGVALGKLVDGTSSSKSISFENNNPGVNMNISNTASIA